MCIHIHVSYVRSSLAAVVYFIVKSETKISPGVEFAEEDIKENCEYSNFESNRIEYSSHPLKSQLLFCVFNSRKVSRLLV